MVVVKSPAIDLEKTAAFSDAEFMRILSVFSEMEGGEPPNILSISDFEAVDSYLEYHQNEYASYCENLRTITLALNLESPNCSSAIRFADHAGRVIGAIRKMPKAATAPPPIETNEIYRFAALEYFGRIFVSAVNNDRYRRLIEMTGCTIQKTDNHVVIFRPGLASIEFDLKSLETGITIFENVQITRDGQKVNIGEWPDLIIAFTSRTPLFRDTFFCQWSFFDNGLILFDFGKADLNDFARARISTLAGVLKRYSQMHLEVTGHADSVGKSEDNVVLASQRAKAVMNELIRLGIEKERLKIVSEGEEKPVDKKKDDQKNRYNRNVQIAASYRLPDGSFVTDIGYSMSGDMPILFLNPKPPESCSVPTTDVHGTY